MTSMYVCHSRTVSPSSNCSRGVPTTGGEGNEAVCSLVLGYGVGAWTTLAVL